MKKAMESINITYIKHYNNEVLLFILGIFMLISFSSFFTKDTTVLITIFCFELILFLHVILIKYSGVLVETYLKEHSHFYSTEYICLTNCFFKRYLLKYSEFLHKLIVTKILKTFM